MEIPNLIMIYFTVKIVSLLILIIRANLKLRGIKRKYNVKD